MWQAFLIERRPPDAHLAPADAAASRILFEGRFLRGGELLVRVDGGQPEAQLVGEVVARAARPVALDERRSPEVLQTRSGAGQRLTAALRTRGSVLYIIKIN